MGYSSNKSATPSPSLKSPQVQRRGSDLSTSDSMQSCASLVQEYTAPSQTLVIIDWDDTLCPSHWIRINRPRLEYFQPCPNDPKYLKPLETLSAAVCKLLRTAGTLGKVTIITNAQGGWVDISCKNFLPGVADVLKQLNVEVIYAREGFEQQDVAGSAYNYNYNINAPQIWKQKAMQKAIWGNYGQNSTNYCRNIISIGDQMCEHLALRFVTRPYKVGFQPPGSSSDPDMKPIRSKTVKLAEEPSVQLLASEVGLVTEKLKQIVTHDGDLSVSVSADESSYLTRSLSTSSSLGVLMTGLPSPLGLPNSNSIGSFASRSASVQLPMDIGQASE